MKSYLPRVLMGVFIFLAAGIFAQKVSAAGVLTNMSVTLSNPTEDTSSYHTVTFKTDNTANTKRVDMLYCKAPSGTCTPPQNLTTSTAVKGTLTGFSNSANWTLDASVDDSPKLGHTVSNENISADTQLTIEMRTITNNSITGDSGDCQNDGELSSDTCYLRISTINDSDATIDIGTASYTVVNAVTVTATVDPSFTFVVSGVNQGTINNGITTSVNSTYNTIPFGNLTVGTPKYAAHKLNVTTNTQNGYYVYTKMSSQMTGVYTNNNIDPYVGTSGLATWSNPIAWTEPNGSTPNDNTGWIGANTTDTDIPNWTSASEKFGPVTSNDAAVMRQTASDNGSFGIYVTYAIESNVFQPADTYTGTVLYTAVPTY